MPGGNKPGGGLKVTPYKMYGKSPMMKALIGKQGNLPVELKNEILASPNKMYDKKSPAKDIKGTYKKVVKKVKKAANKSTLTNPKSSSEHMSDMGDARMHTSYLKDINNAKTPEARKKAENNPMYKHYSEKSKKNRPNKKDRY